MANSTIAIDEPAVTDKLLDTTSLTVGANTVERERVNIAGSGATDIAPVDATAGLKVDLGADNDVTVSGSVTVSGTVTADLGATDNAVLDAIAASLVDVETNTDFGAVVGGGTEAAAVRVTIANNSTGVLSVDDNGGALTVDGTVTADLGATDNAVLDTIASPVATISSTPLQRVAIFDAADAQITSFGGGTQYTEDAAAAANPVGTAPILVRADTPATVTSTDGDNIAQRATNYGAAFVQVVDSSGSFVDTFGGSGGTASIDDADFTQGSTQGTPAMGVYESTPTSVTDGDMGIVGIDVNRQLKVAAAQAGTWNVTNVSGTVSLPTGAATAANQSTIIGHVDGIEGLLTTIDSDTSALAGAVAGSEVQVDVVAALPAGTNAIGKLAANSGVDIGDVDILSIAAGDNNIGNVDIVTMPNVTLAAGTNTNEVVGDAAHDAAIAGNPVRIGGRALTADYTAVAAGDVADFITTLLGKQVIYPYANPNQQWTYAAASGGITNTTGVTAKAAAGAGVRNYITRAQIINGHATVSTDVQIRDGASGTVLWRGFAQAAGGGITAVFDPPLRGTANTLVEVACGTTGTATYFNLQGFTAAE